MNIKACPKQFWLWDVDVYFEVQDYQTLVESSLAHTSYWQDW
jgi:hypothetical protein